MSKPFLRGAVLCISIVAFISGWPLAARQNAAIRVIKISGGPTGVERNGTFVLESERSMFNRTDDREVFVLFQWDGTPGPHKLVARWRSPDGRLTSNSEVDYLAAAARFGAYWSLPLTSSMALGFWSVEATVDGLPGGQFSFELTDRQVPSAITKPMLTKPQLFERLDKAFLVIERAAGQKRLPTWSATAAHNGAIYTTAAALDSADRMELVTRQGLKPLADVTGFSRPQGWTLLAAPGVADDAPRAGLEKTAMGSRCLSMMGSESSGRVIVECEISGRAERGGTTVLIAQFRSGSASPGAPVMNEFGELIGIVGDRPVISSQATEDLGAVILPVELFAAGTTTTLADLRSRGATLSALVGEERVLLANLAATDKAGKPVARELKQGFSLSEKWFGIVIWWDTKDRIRGDATVQLFDPFNNLIGTSKPSKVDARKGQTSQTGWGVPLPDKPGSYRVDLLLSGEPIWRTTLRVSP